MGVSYSTEPAASNIGEEDSECQQNGSRSSEHKYDGCSYRDVAKRINIDQDCTIVPSTRLCFYCCKEGKEHPIEHFLCYPCCGYYICRDCMEKNRSSCGECITVFPLGNNSALQWIDGRKEKERSRNCHYRNMHLRGKVHIDGSHLFVDELLLLPVYRYEKIKPRSTQLSIMNPSNVQAGVACLEIAAKDGSISAMIDLADVYCTNFANNPFQKHKRKAEHWYVRALGEGNRICPYACTRYGDFLKFEQRSEAPLMYELAALNGHARGQYEYAVFLLGRNDDVGESDSDTSNNDIEKAVCFLCKASEKGFYAPSYTLLAKTLIDIAEKAYGMVYAVGKSPLSRAIQILALAKNGRYGISQACEDETSTLFDNYGRINKKCSNCGQVGSEIHPLRLCGTCGVLAYCSKVCQKRDYRDGHKFDCCSSKDLLNFQSIRQTLPWVSKIGGIGEMPHLNSTGERSLVQMVEDETDELYGEEDQDYDEDVLRNLMFRMRKNLETYLNKELQDGDLNLQNQINRFLKKIEEYPGCHDFIQAMNTIRTIGNNAAHSNQSEDQKLLQLECEEAVSEYRLLKENYETYRETIYHESNKSKTKKTRNKKTKKETIDDLQLKVTKVTSITDNPVVLPKALDTSSSNNIPRVSNDECTDNTTLNASQFTATLPITVENVMSTEKKSNKSKKKKTKSKKIKKETIDDVQHKNTKIIAVTEDHDAPDIEPKTKENRAGVCLNEYIATNNLLGIERIISEWKGVPGFGKLRKRAKGAANKLRNEGFQVDIYLQEDK